MALLGLVNISIDLTPRVLDTLHFTFAMHMMYTYLLAEVMGDPTVEEKAVWYVVLPFLHPAHKSDPI
jgi:hypothetical protein